MFYPPLLKLLLCEHSCFNVHSLGAVYFFFVSYLQLRFHLLIVCVCTYVHTHSVVCMRRSEASLKGSLLSFYRVRPGMNLIRLGANTICGSSHHPTVFSVAGSLLETCPHPSD